MSFEMLVAVLLAVVALIIFGLLIVRTAPKKTRKTTFQKRWKEIYGYCAHKETWPSALSQADALLDMALKRRKYKGKNMGERMVAAQKVFNNNDSLWAAHKLVTKVKNHPKARLSEKDVKGALIAYRQGLKDLSVL